MTTPTLLDHAREALEDVAKSLRAAGATLPAPPVSGTIDGSIISGLCIALCVVEQKIADLDRARADNGWLPIESPPAEGEWVICFVDHRTNPQDKFIKELLGNREMTRVLPAVCYYIDREGYPSFCRWVLPSGSPVGILENVTHWQPLPAPPIATERTSQEVGNG